MMMMMMKWIDRMNPGQKIQEESKWAIIQEGKNRKDKHMIGSL